MVIGYVARMYGNFLYDKKRPIVWDPCRTIPRDGGKKYTASLYQIDCLGGVICNNPDEERTSIVGSLVIKNCSWTRATYKNLGPGRVRLSFARQGDGCWELRQETTGDPEPDKISPPAEVRTWDIK